MAGEAKKTNGADGVRHSYERFKRLHYHHEVLGLSVDFSRMNLEPADVGLDEGPMAAKLGRALAQMAELEAGSMANPDEGRRVGHYWLRAPELAPEDAQCRDIEVGIELVTSLARRVHTGELRPPSADSFKHVLVMGIGGSALGPQLICHGLRSATEPMSVHFLDNTDPDGIDGVVAELGSQLGATLSIVISKSGGTKETRNCMLEISRAYERRGLDFGKHAMAVTGEGSKLDTYAAEKGFLARLPMWDWVGGRTSVMSAVGLLPAALQGLPVTELLRGARLMDEATRQSDLSGNPGALLAAAWHCSGGGRGAKDMVVIPYKDRLSLLSRYLQQLIMESLGKRLDLAGQQVEQGISVYGNKGSTDQHAYVQQLLDGLDNSFVTFIEVLRDRAAGAESIDVEPGVTTGDFLSGFLQGTRRALADKQRPSLTITVEQVDAQTVGALIALYERAVGLYAFLVNINAYHQPAVEAGKRAAQQVLELQAKLLAALRNNRGKKFTVEQLATAVDSRDPETIFWILRHLAANPERGLGRHLAAGAAPWEARFSFD